MGFLDKFIRKGESENIADLRAALDRLSLAAAEAAVTTLEQERHALLLTGTDAEVAAKDEEIAVANRQVERVGAARDALAARIMAAQDADDDAELRKRYTDAQRAQEAAVKRLLMEYPKHAVALTGLLRAIADADLLVQTANEALPHGAERLLTVEARARTEPEAPARVIADEVRAAWCWASGHQLTDSQAETVASDDDGETGTWRSPLHPPTKVYRRRFRHLTTIPDAPGRQIGSLATTLNLPPLAAGHVPFWAPFERDAPRSVGPWLDNAATEWGRAHGAPGLYTPSPETEVIPLDGPRSISA